MVNCWVRDGSGESSGSFLNLLSLFHALESSERRSMSAKFNLGQIVATQGVARSLSPDEIFVALARHESGDWGELDDEDKRANERALLEEGRLVSKYLSVNGTPFYIITEWDRSLTTVLLPQEY